MRRLALAVCLLSLTAGTAAADLPTGSSTLFAGSGVCAMCHVSDGSANTENGVDVSPVTQWRSTMMANSARDPLWRAKVSAEIDTYPQLREAIETKCTRCHAPLGNAEAEYLGQTGYSLAEMEADPLAMDGVSCTLCHQIQPDNLGLPESYSGHFQVENVHEIYGPFANPLTQQMQNASGYTPVQAEHTSTSELCATCHTLFTAHVNDAGGLEGSFPEQTPYLEWKNSRFRDDGIECQACHMPVAPSGIDIATMPFWHQVQRSPFSYHTMTGANAFMLGILRNNIDLLGLTATAAQFDSSIARTLHTLQNQTVALAAGYTAAGDSLQVDVRVENLTGHKLPTGIPLRRMWLHVLVQDGTGATIFESGAWNDQGEITGLDDGYEPHHDLITDGNQVQVYETIMQDQNGDLTWTLLRAASYRKDNRIPPKGFTTSAAVYDSVRIEGGALADGDFNVDAGGEGSGADIVHYRFPRPDGQPLHVTVQAVYQTLPPRVFADLSTHDTPEIQLFSNMYQAADKTPILLAELTLEIDAATDIAAGGPPAAPRLFQNVPNPFNPTTLISYELRRDEDVRILIHDLGGRRVRTLFTGRQSAGGHAVTWDGRDDQGVALPSGTYIYSIETAGGRDSRRMVLIR